MSDLHVLLPDFPSIDKYASLLSGLEVHRVSLSELLTLDAAEIGKRTRLPLLDLQRLSDDVRVQLLKKSARPAPKLRLRRKAKPAWEDADGEAPEVPESEETETPNTKLRLPLGRPGRISTLDPALDAALGGGFPAGVLSEIVGESGAGKTQLLLSLLIAVQLPPPRGLGRKALYIATEAPLATSRLTQIIHNNPDSMTLQQHCSLQSIFTINVSDLEAQEHILTHQLPVQLSKAEQYGGPSGSFGLVIIDSVAANFRPFFGGKNTNNGAGGSGGGPGAPSKEADSAGNGGPKGSTSLAARSLELQRLGALLRALAQKHNLAVVVANQVADRFSDGDGLEGGDSGGGLLSLSQQWSGGGATSHNGDCLRIPKHASSAKRPRQDESEACSGGLSIAQAGETPAPPPPPQPQVLSTSHSMPRTNPLTLTQLTQLKQESPLAARSRKLQQVKQAKQAKEGEPATVGPGAAFDTPTTPASPAVPPGPMLSQPTAGTEEANAKSASSVLPAGPALLAKSEMETRTSETDAMPFPSSQYIPPSQFPPPPPAPPVLQLDHQQRWFTGWGDSLGGGGGGGGGGVPRNKTPSLGLVWAIQLGMRVALIKAPRIGRSRRHPGDSSYFPGPHDANGGGDDDEEEYNEETVAERHNMGAPRLRHSWRRWLKVVFAPHVASTGATAKATATATGTATTTATGTGTATATATATTATNKTRSSPQTHRAVEFEITAGGLCAIN